MDDATETSRIVFTVRTVVSSVNGSIEYLTRQLPDESSEKASL